MLKGVACKVGSATELTAQEYRCLRFIKRNKRNQRDRLSRKFGEAGQYTQRVLATRGMIGTVPPTPMALGGGVAMTHSSTLLLSPAGAAAFRDYRDNRRRYWFDHLAKFTVGFISGVAVGLVVALLVARLLP